MQDNSEMIATGGAGTHGLGTEQLQRWLEIFERLRRADLGLSFSEKVRLYCEAGDPSEIESLIEQRLITVADLPAGISEHPDDVASSGRAPETVNCPD